MEECRLTLDQRHLDPERGEQESVAAEARRRIHDSRVAAVPEAHGPRQRLLVPEPVAQPMPKRAGDEVTQGMSGSTFALFGYGRGRAKRLQAPVLISRNESCQ